MLGHARAAAILAAAKYKIPVFEYSPRKKNSSADRKIKNSPCNAFQNQQNVFLSGG